MDSSNNTRKPEQSHVLAIPYPGRGHINPMMNFCKRLVIMAEHVHVTFIVTEEWHGFLVSEPRPDRIELCSIPNVIPSEKVRANDMPRFVDAVWTRMEAPIEEVLDQLQSPVSVIVADTWLGWVVEFGKRRNIPVASFWTSSAVFIWQQFRNGHHDESANQVKGASSAGLEDTASPLDEKSRQLYGRFLQARSLLPKAQYLLITVIYEMEAEIIDALKLDFPFPVYSVGPSIPYLELEAAKHTSNNYVDQFNWLDCQPSGSVLYISFGSFLSVSSSQVDEIALGLRESGVRFLWVAQDETDRLKQLCGERGLVVSWCDQLKVLRHSSVGGFLTHCGWNSIQEGSFAGVPFLVFPIGYDQFLNGTRVVEDWKTGWGMKENLRAEGLVPQKDIAELVKKFMDPENIEGKEIRVRAKEIQRISERAISKDGSSGTNFYKFVGDISFD